MRTLSYVALALSSALVAPAHAQFTAFPAVQPTTPADQLAAVMRRLAAAPTDLQALISAGELSVKLDDMSAAAAFFARADKIDGRNGRVKAGMASILVRAERPGEALRFYQLAESYGLDPSRYAADRGLAYDLVGEQERAQRDYRLALRTARDDETVRRYALSLGISGKPDAALAELDPLLRRGDRAAWRVRTFVAAMSGDVEGARRTATSMMPAGMAAGLQPFFQRLPTLPAVDRAFAVHFGEVRPTPARLADARMKPLLPPLGPDPYAPVQVAARTPAPAPAAAQPTRARDDRRAGRERVQLASRRAPTRVVPASSIPGSSAALAARQMPRTMPPTQVAARTVAPSASPGFGQVARPAPTTTVPPTTQPAPSSYTRPVQPVQTQTASPAPGLAAAQPVTAPPARVVTAQPVAPAAMLAATQPSPPPVAAAQPVTSPPTQLASVASTSLPRPFTPAPTAAPASVPPVTGATPASSAPVVPAAVAGTPTPSPGTAVAALPSPQPVQPAAVTYAPATTAVASAAPAPGFSNVGAELAAATPAAPTPAVRSEDSILARIVASITIPGEELGIAAPDRPAPVPAQVAADPAAARTLAAGSAKAAEEKADRAAAAKTIAAATKTKPAEAAKAAPKAEETKPATRGRNGRVELASRSADRAKPGAKADEDAKPKTAAEKRLADRKAAEEKGATDKKGASKKAAAEEKPNAPRIWVQVAGGASESDLSKAWTAAQRKAAALKGRDAYTTPLRATNRVVTGPFKTEAEAQAFVNQLARQGVSAFQFTSANGQKMTKLSAK
ncbi:SPOR domain-containing protein [Sphingomonas lenta]|uniref:Sporulation protein n=1 Tax=Sphingomonas lenta TaxID=1141887 RepID=A0A2A2SHD3_9SPHN|nr:SPOR domain-containing protein [Sphingomonas lenta]PAX08704.1 sporulation protein [Sphingomonas lenta]